VNSVLNHEDRQESFVQKSFALLFGYQRTSFTNTWTPMTTDDDNNFAEFEDGYRSDGVHLAKVAGRWLEERFVGSLRGMGGSTPIADKGNNCLIVVLNRTQASVAKLRSTSLELDSDCIVCGDVLVLTIKLPGRLANNLLSLEQHVTPLLSPGPDFRHNGTSIDLLACKVLNGDAALHAEQSCTQYVYYYMIPVTWFPEIELLQQWLDCGNLTTPPPVDSLRRLKQHCRSAESPRVDPARKRWSSGASFNDSNTRGMNGFLFDEQKRKKMTGLCINFFSS
jgi:hypothetical protein